MARFSALAAVGFVFVVACGSSGTGDDDAAQVGDDADAGNETPDVTVGPDANQPKDSGPQDSTTPPSNDATLDVNFGDAIWTADSGGGPPDTGVDTGGGCAPDGILCSGNTAEICKSGTLSTICKMSLECNEQL